MRCDKITFGVTLAEVLSIDPWSIPVDLCANCFVQDLCSQKSVLNSRDGVEVDLIITTNQPWYAPPREPKFKYHSCAELP